MDVVISVLVLWAIICAVMALESDVLMAIWKRVRGREFREIFLIGFAAPFLCLFLYGEYAWNRFVRRKKPEEIE